MEIFAFIDVHGEQIIQKVVYTIQEDGIYQYLVYLIAMHQQGLETLFSCITWWSVKTYFSLKLYLYWKMQVGTLNRTGIIYKGHFDIWLINHLQLQLEATRHLIPESQTLTGWVNGDLYIPAGERIGILP